MKDARPGAPRAMPGIAPSAGRDHRHLTIDEIIGESRHLIVMTLRPAVFDRHVPALDISCLFQSLTKCVQADSV
jgi:hypothetical protein